MIGKPFEAHIGLTAVEAAIYDIDGYGHRILQVRRNPGGSLKNPTQTRCFHDRVMLSVDVKVGDRQGYVQLCRLCAFETARREL